MAKSDTHRRRALILVENAPITRDRRVLLEARALRDHGFVVSVICPRSGDRGATFEWLDGIGVHWMPLPQNVTGINGYLTEYGAAFWHALRLSVRTLRVPGFDVLQVCNPPDIFFPFALLFRLFGKRFIFDQHDLTPETFKVQFGEGSVRSRWLLRLLYLCERITYRVSDVVMVTNESFRERALRAGVPPERLFVVRNGPNEERLRRVPPDITLKQGRTHLVCYVGLMGYQDGVSSSCVPPNAWFIAMGVTT